MLKFSNEELEIIYKFAIIDKWTWQDLMIFVEDRRLDMSELADVLAWGIDAEGYDRDKDLETDCPWCCPWMWAPSARVLSIEDFAEKYIPEIERLLKEEREAKDEED